MCACCPLFLQRSIMARGHVLSGAGEAPIWRRIALDWCGDSAVASAGFIVERARYPRHSRKAPAVALNLAMRLVDQEQI
jgi:hypothetical protein